jgi:RND family efflux transporter MFP subunit
VFTETLRVPPGPASRIRLAPMRTKKTLAESGRLRMLWRVGSTLGAIGGLASLLVWMGGAFRTKVMPGEVTRERPGAAGRALVPVERSPIDETITAVASVQPRRKAEVASQIIASVLEVKVQPGDKVKAGDVLIVLDDRELIAQQREAMATVAVAEADLGLRKRDYDRIMSLAPGSASKDELGRVSSAYDISQAQLKRSRQQVARIEVQLTYTQIKTAAPGVVADRYADPGDLAVPGKPLLTVQDTRELELQAFVPESLALAIGVGQKLQLRIDAANVGGIGVVREVVPLAQQASRSVLVKVSLPADLSTPIYAGMFGRVTIPVGQAVRLLVPQAAVGRVGQLELVEVVDAREKLERRFVRTGRTFNDKVEVLSGVNEGERVALSR